jgi:hypothetical protein
MIDINIWIKISLAEQISKSNENIYTFNILYVLWIELR